MNWYVIVAIVSSFLLGWGIGIWHGTTKGYEAANEEHQQLRNQQIWSAYLESLAKKEDSDEKR
jgi:hypothetical protein